MPPESNEDTLMAAYAAGDRAALDAMFNLLAPRLLAFFRRCLPDPCLAEELLQRTFVQLHHARHAYRAGTPVRHFLYGIAASVRCDELGRVPGALPPPAANEPEPPRARRSTGSKSGASESLRERAVRDAFAALQSSQRLVIHLHRFEGMSFGEIAQIIGVSEHSIRRQAFQTYQLLHEHLQPLVDRGTP